jgi:hypothetical protein
MYVILISREGITWLTGEKGREFFDGGGFS